MKTVLGIVLIATVFGVGFVHTSAATYQHYRALIPLGMGVGVALGINLIMWDYFSRVLNK